MYTFLSGESNGNTEILPFLTTTEVLRLSECCRALQKYQYYLPVIKITSPTHVLLKQKMVRKLICGQGTQQLVVDFLTTMDCPYLHTLELPGWKEHEVFSLVNKTLVKDEKYFHKINKVVLNGTCLLAYSQICDETGVALTALMKKHCLQYIEHLTINCAWSLSTFGIDDDNEDGVIVPIIKQLDKCPKLKTLNMVSLLGETAVEALTTAFEKGYCPNLQYLEMSFVSSTTHLATSLCKVIWSGALPNLKVLRLPWMDESEEALILETVQQSGKCPCFETTIFQSYDTA